MIKEKEMSKRVKNTTQNETKVRRSKRCIFIPSSKRDSEISRTLIKGGHERGDQLRNEDKRNDRETMKTEECFRIKDEQCRV